MNMLVGYTGFVGSNIYAAGAFQEEYCYHSRNIKDAYGKQPELLVYAGLRAEKYLANTLPEKDLALITEAEENIRQIAPKKLVLISTVDVYKHPVGVDEDSVIDTEHLHPYGYNRYRLEQWVRREYPDALIVRLPGLYGKDIKKNFIYDYMRVIPAMLKAEKYAELAERAPILRTCYVKQDNGFYKYQPLPLEEEEALKETFKEMGFTALNFTDSRSSFQMYPLNRLWQDIQKALGAGINVWNPATEPVTAEEIYQHLCGGALKNHISDTPAQYDYRTKYDTLFGGKKGYIMTKEEVLKDLKTFVETYTRRSQ